MAAVTLEPSEWQVACLERKIFQSIAELSRKQKTGQVSVSDLHQAMLRDQKDGDSQGCCWMIREIQRFVDFVWELAEQASALNHIKVTDTPELDTPELQVIEVQIDTQNEEWERQTESHCVNIERKLAQLSKSGTRKYWKDRRRKLKKKWRNQRRRLSKDAVLKRVLRRLEAAKELDDKWQACFVAPPKLKLDWKTMPFCLKPEYLIGENPLRVTRKQRQVDSVYALLELALAQHRDSGAGAKRLKVIDFGSGSGNVGLPLAWHYRDTCDFVLVDRVAESLKFAQQRIDESGLSDSVTCLCADLSDTALLEQQLAGMAVGVAVHCCGDASDFVLDFCAAQRASFVVMPCCVGKIQSSKFATLKYPRSQWMAGNIADYDEYVSMCRAADHNVECGLHLSYRRHCKRVLEMDRLERAKEAKFYSSVYLTKVYEPDEDSLSPKSDILVGLI